MKQKVYIRADGSSDIGLGHVVRCISLSHMLKDDFSVHFFSLKIPDSLKNEIIQNGWDLTVIEKELDFFNGLNGHEIVVLDGYKFDSEYQKLIKKKIIRLVCIDDLGKFYNYADVVINHSPGAQMINYSGENYTQYYLGLEYALLRPFFYEKSDVKSSKNKKIKILICFGGSDPKNYSLKTVDYLSDTNYEMNLVLGPAYTHKLPPTIFNYSNLTIVRNLDAAKLKNLMLICDYGIVAASGILIECIYTKLLTICTPIVDNQNNIFQAVKQYEFSYGISNYTEHSLRTALQILVKGNNEMKNICDKLSSFDGSKTPDRILKIFKSL